MNQSKLILASVSLFLTGAFTAQAQSDAATTTTTTTANTTTTDRTTTTTPVSSYRAADEFGPHKGSWEFTLGGSGGSNKSLNNSLGGVNATLGFYLNDSLEVSVRQSGNYTNGSGSGGANYDGSTFVGLDQHFGTGRLRPFVGLNFGGLYGDSTNDSWAAGIEGGLKFYVQPKTFGASTPKLVSRPELNSMVVREDRSAVQADAGNAEDFEFDGEDVARLAHGVIARGLVHACHFTIGKGRRVKARGLLRVLVEQRQIVFLGVD